MDHNYKMPNNTIGGQIVLSVLVNILVQKYKTFVREDAMRFHRDSTHGHILPVTNDIFDVIPDCENA